jgi:hypothetical protein
VQCGGIGSYLENGNSLECADCAAGGKCRDCNGTGHRRGVLGNLWRSYASLDYYEGRFITAGILAVCALSVLFWRFMLPLIAFITAVTLFLRWSRSRNSL